MTDDEITPERRIELLGAALHAIAWQLVEDETDTSDRGVSEEHYRDALERAKTILPTLMPGVVAEEPEWEYVPGWIADNGRARISQGVIAPGYVAEFIAEGGEVVRRRVSRFEKVTADMVPVKQEGVDQ